MTGAASESPNDHLRRVVEAADERKALDMRVLDLRSICDFTDHFLICSAASNRQVQAIASAIEEALAERGVKPHHLEGAQQGRWILLDYGDFVVHIFDQERRDYYRLEDIWSDAPDVTDTFLRDAQPAAEP
ncbi:MAG TPA: ribosome silencing factor [Thermoanaerobaculia bacterium]|nr:ribosome silencing factor [Thermoanaerobaculia bacterium]